MTGDWTTREPLSSDDLAEQLTTLGVERGGVLLVHMSYRAVRPIVGGPLGLIEGLERALGPQGTLVMPSSTDDDDAPFDPATTPADPVLGVTVDSFWRLPGVCRSDHPFAFAARGPQARHVTADPVAFPPFPAASPPGRVHELDGQILLLGVGHDANTTLHFAELTAGVPYRRPKNVTLLQDGRAVRRDYGENDHCCQRFALADDWLRARGQQTEGPVGYAPARLMRSRDLVTAACEELSPNLLLFLHPQGSGCDECDDAWRSVTR